ncbi:hypothetical protein BV25DRAFT_1820468 [Artomyces pyxidatus]|uniref:Uncharacterized protein n=1 Tax=Artomyces pyxidatus TaxID=48021 RepID=A0ACB8TDK9_9AGAM|nr:hypothetical protein BV25DRAFT_1820468 [Artomyces pyxidatus]
MGCIPSKQKALQQFDDGTAPQLPSKKPKKTKKNRGPPSPVVEGEPAPWVRGHAVLVLNEDAQGGEVFVMEKGT